MSLPVVRINKGVSLTSSLLPRVQLVRGRTVALDPESAAGLGDVWNAFVLPPSAAPAQGDFLFANTGFLFSHLERRRFTKVTVKPNQWVSQREREDPTGVTTQEDFWRGGGQCVASFWVSGTGRCCSSAWCKHIEGGKFPSLESKTNTRLHSEVLFLNEPRPLTSDRNTSIELAPSNQRYKMIHLFKPEL